MGKRLISVLLTAVLLVGLLPAHAGAASGGDIDGTNLKWSLADNGTLTISGSGAMKDFTLGFDFTTGTETADTPWWGKKDNITAVVIENGVTTIGVAAFLWCSNLKEVTIPSSVKTIGEATFFQCSSLTSVTIPSSVTMIGEDAFLGCSNLKEVTIPSSVKTIGEGAFWESGLTAVTISEGVETIGNSAFSGCFALTSVTIPSSVTTIGDYAFASCSSLTSVTISEGVETIGDAAFHYCTALKEVTIPSSVTTIGEAAFYCSNLKEVTISSRVTTIERAAFALCENLETATFLGKEPPSMGSIFGYSNIKTVNVPAGKESVYQTALDGKDGIDFSKIKLTSCYMAEFSPNGGAGYVAPIVQEAPQNTITLPDSTGFTPPTGKEFAGWSTDQNGSNPLPANRPVDQTADPSVLYYAIWTPITYSLTIVNDGTGGSQSGRHAAGEKIILNSGTREGFNFVGWSVEPDTYQNDLDGNMFTMPANNVTITAIWTPIIYSLTIADAGTGGSQSGRHAAGEKITLNSGTREGFNFVGWSVEPDTYQNNLDGNMFTMPDADVKITANWREQPTPEPEPEPEPTPPPAPAPQPTPPSGGGSGSPPSPSYYPPRVNQTAGGTVEISPARPQRGDTVTITATPDAGKMVSFVGATDRNGNVIEVTENGGIWTFTQPISVVTVGVVFVDEVQPWHNPFGDVQPDDWCYDAVQYVTENGLMTGTGMSAFSPNATSTRAMLWAILARQDGEEISGRAWVAQAQAWATESGISDGTNPSGTLTREQLVTMLYRAAGSPTVSGDLSAFADASSVSAYAQAPLAWAVENGIVGGVGGNRIDPLGSATRAQLAAMLMRYTA